MAKIFYRFVIHKFSSFSVLFSFHVKLDGLVIQKQEEVPQGFDLLTYYYPLSNAVWICILATSVLTILTRLITKIPEESFFSLFWESFALYFGGHFDTFHANRQNVYKIFAFVLLFCGNIVWMGYQASLTVDLSVSPSKLLFSDFETFLKTN